MKLLKICTIAILFGGMVSCDDFLTRTPEHSLTETNAITNPDKAVAAVAGIYSTFQTDEWAGGLYLYQSTKAGFSRYGGDLNYSLSYDENNTGFLSDDVWQSFYKSLNAANFAVNGITKLSDESFSSPGKKQVLIAEARCLRAWVNANLLWNFAHWWAGDDDEYGLLYRDKVVDLGNLKKARITVGESYEKIYEDLDFAIDNLDDYTAPQHVSKQFAQVLKAKLLLYRGGYSDNQEMLNSALTLVNDVENSAPASWAMEPDMEELYNKSWDSKENLFARTLEPNGSGDYYYPYYLSTITGDDLPLGPGEELTADLAYGLDWFKSDPRWEIETGPVGGSSASFYTDLVWTWKKVARMGRYNGQHASPPDLKFAAYYFRKPELYIMKSELLARTGASVSEAIAPINEMHSKRTNPDLPTLNPGSRQELMDMIFKEYFLELYLENGSEFFAALRFDHAGDPWIVTIKDGLPLEEDAICWPIPHGEILNNPLMVQNPGLE